MLKAPKRTQIAALEAATAGYEADLGQVADYLTGRGITRDMAVTFRLGYVATPAPGHEPYAGRLAIPYITPAGVVDIRFRAVVDTEGAKYLSRPGAQPTLFNVGAFFRPSMTVAICEGELDTVVMDTVSGVPAVGCPGVQLWKPYYNRLFADHRVLVMCDGDDAGRDFGKRLAREVDGAVPIHLPDGHDVNSLFQAGGADAVRALLPKD